MGSQDHCASRFIDSLFTLTGTSGRARANNHVATPTLNPSLLVMTSCVPGHESERGIERHLEGGQ